MKLRTILFFVLFAFVVSGLSASDKGPIAVSPGSDVGIAVVGENCPTFSWTSVEWAKGYKIDVFEMLTAEVLSYENMAASAHPVLSKEIQGRALSWTPSSDERLSNGSVYVWYVQAMDAYGTVKWSEGKAFKVGVIDRLRRIGEKLNETLKTHGVSDEVISDVLREIDSELEEVDIGSDSQTNGYRTQDKLGIQGNESGSNTWYGESAGASLTTGDANTFMGQYAGHSTTTGSYNTFIGQRTGYHNTSGNYNTFIGQDAGMYNTSGNSSTFIGQAAGYKNTSGNYNTFIGQDAGVKNTTAYYNTFIGQYSGVDNTTGNSNTFLGQSAGANNETGNYNTFIGRSAGVGTTTGYSNTFIGWAAGAANKTGYGNIFLGYYAGYFETGSNKLYIDNSNTSSPLIYGEFDSDIVAINGKLGVGTQSPGYDLEVETTGKNALLVLDRTDGAKAGYAAYRDKAILGTVTDHPLYLGVNSGWRLRLKSDNSMVMANGAQCTTGGVWQDASSRAFKENILDLTFQEAKDALLSLCPVKYNYKTDSEDEHLGFIAEDVPDLVASKDRKGMSPMDVVAVLTKVVQEQQDTISELQERIAKLEKKSQ